jgi:hypothetical protein
MQAWLIILRTKNHYFCEQCQATWYCNEEARCLLWGRSWSSNNYWDEVKEINNVNVLNVLRRMLENECLRKRRKRWRGKGLDKAANVTCSNTDLSLSCEREAKKRNAQIIFVKFDRYCVNWYKNIKFLFWERVNVWCGLGWPSSEFGLLRLLSELWE